MIVLPSVNAAGRYPGLNGSGGVEFLRFCSFGVTFVGAAIIVVVRGTSGLRFACGGSASPSLRIFHHGQGSAVSV
jgi:hypothetical protein